MTALLVRGERPGLTRPEQWLRGAAALLALTSTGFAVWYLVKGLATESQYPYAANSVAKDLLLVGLAALVFWDVRRWAAIAVPLIVLVHVAMPVGHARWSAPSTGSTTPGSGRPRRADAFRNGWLAADVGVAIAFVWLHRRAVRARYDLRYLPPSAFRALMAMAQVLVLRKEPLIAPAEVAVRVDRYLAGFRAQRKWLIRARAGRAGLLAARDPAPAVPHDVGGPARALDQAPVHRRRRGPGDPRVAAHGAADDDPRGAAVLLHGLLRATRTRRSGPATSRSRAARATPRR